MLFWSSGWKEDSEAFLPSNPAPNSMAGFAQLPKLRVELVEPDAELDVELDAELDAELLDWVELVELDAELDSEAVAADVVAAGGGGAALLTATTLEVAAADEEPEAAGQEPLLALLALLVLELDALAPELACWAAEAGSATSLAGLAKLV